MTASKSVSEAPLPSPQPSTASSALFQPQGQEWFSLEGFLYMKWPGALNFLQSRKRLYFGLEERENRLVYFRDKADFDRRINRLGHITLVNSACTVVEGNCKGFVVHSEGKKFELEAENEQSADCWLHALQHRKDVNDNSVKNGAALPAVVWSNIRRRRSRSRSFGSESGRDSPNMNRNEGTDNSRIARGKKINRKAKSFRIGTTLLNGSARKVQRIRSFNAALVSRNGTTNSTNSVDTTPDKPPEESSARHFSTSRKSSAPLWLDDWITNWLHEQNELSPVDTSLEARQHRKADVCDSSPVSASSSTTSTYTSDQEHEIVSEGDEEENLIAELTLLRMINNRQKEMIENMTAEVHDLREEIERRKKLDSLAAATASQGSKTSQHRFLNAEILRLNDRHQQAEKIVDDLKKKIGQLQSEMEDVKKEYVFLLQSCVRIPLHEHSHVDVVQVKLFGGEVHQKRVCKLLSVAREEDPTLPTFERVTNPSSFHVDEYGFKHCFEDRSLALHYICTQLNQHYLAQTDDYVARKRRWQYLLNKEQCFLENNPEIRQLCRAGIPRSLRSKVWRVLINQKISDIKAKYGNYYYRNLCQSHGTTADKHYINVHQKQINLDLLRTMPNNIHFMSATCKGVTHLQAILRAYCLHNPHLGYCQGMNFIAATALLFVSPEDAFWFLVAITERFFDKSYFDQSLTGAQADQEVLKEIMEQKFPRLTRHLEEHDIDLTTITLNWFLALFFDAVPFQTMLRIWDCFLLEGSRVLFRVSIALLGLYEEEILDRSDTISVIKVLKAAVRLTYDVDGLIHFAFDELSSFPSKNQLAARQASYLAILQDRLMKRQQIRHMFGDHALKPSKAETNKLCDLPVDCITFSDSSIEQGIGYVCAGNQKRGKLGLITFFKEGAANLNMLGLEFDCRPVSMVVFERGMAFVSLLSGYVVAVQLSEGNEEVLWELKLSDVALKLIHNENKLYSALANGSLAILENAFNKAPTALDLYHIPISAAPITDAIIVEDNLCLAVACKIVILNKNTLSPISSIYVAASATGSTVPMFEKIRALSDSEYGIWIITAHSSLVQLWKETECQLLFDITYDHSHRKPSFDEHDEMDMVEINKILYFDNEIWIGTVDGYLMLYHVHPRDPFDQPADAKQSLSRPSSSNEIAFSLLKYPPGKRLCPDNNVSHDIPVHRQQMYYIPTQTETQVEESTSGQERSPNDFETRKISVVIDQSTKQYSVSVAPMRSISIDSARETLKSNSTHPSASRPPPLNIRRLRSGARSTTRGPLEKNTSVDSAVSVFTDPVKSGRNSLASDECCSGVATITESKENPESPIFSTGDASLEYDDMFEMYSDPDAPHEIGLIEDILCNRSPPPQSKLVQIPVRKMSFSAFGPCSIVMNRQISSVSDCLTAVDERPKDPEAMDTSQTTSAATGSDGGLREEEEPDVPKLRRKDLDFDDPLILAVKDAPDDIAAAERKQSYHECARDVVESEIKSTLTLSLQMKVKISDKPVRCITLTSFEGENVVVTGAGNYGDEEAILRWRKEKVTGIWINDPLVDCSVHGRRRTVFGKK